MSTRNLTCIGCPMGCQLTAELAGGEVVSVRGNTCARGEAYARKECVHPARTVTGTVRCEGGVLPVVSVRDGGRGAEGEGLRRGAGARCRDGARAAAHRRRGARRRRGHGWSPPSRRKRSRQSKIIGSGTREGNTRKRCGEFFAAPLVFYGQIVVRYFICPLKRRVARCAMHSSRHWKIRP